MEQAVAKIDSENTALEPILAAASRCRDGVILVVPRAWVLPKDKPVGQLAGIDVYCWPSKGM